MAGINLNDLVTKGNNQYSGRKTRVNLSNDLKNQLSPEKDESTSPRPQPPAPANHLKKSDPVDVAHKKLDKIEKNIAPANRQLRKQKKKEAKKITVTTTSQQSDNTVTTRSQPTGNEVTTASQSTSNTVTTLKQQSDNKNLRTASRVEYLMQKGLPKQITRFIASNAKREGETWVCYFNSSDFLEKYSLEKKKIKQVANAIDRMKKVGWFAITDSSKGGMRRLEIDPSIYGL